jgi:hypothetical protein
LIALHAPAGGTISNGGFRVGRVRGWRWALIWLSIWLSDQEICICELSMTLSCMAGEILVVTVFKVHHVNGQMEATNTIFAMPEFVKLRYPWSRHIPTVSISLI